MNDDPGVVRITLRDVHSDLQDVKTQMTSFSSKFDTFAAALEERERASAKTDATAEIRLDGLETRVSVLERWRAAVPLSALTAALTAAAAAVVAVVSS